MFKLSPIRKKTNKLHKLLNNGYRFVIMHEDEIIEPFRYEIEARRKLFFGRKPLSISDLIDSINDSVKTQAKRAP